MELKTLRIPSKNGKTFELLRNIAAARLQKCELTGIIYMETLSVEASKQLIDTFDNQPVFSQEQKCIAMFCVENMGRIKEVKAWKKDK